MGATVIVGLLAVAVFKEFITASGKGRAVMLCLLFAR
jgi:hypothetical protein